VASRCGTEARRKLAVSKACALVMQACQDAQEATDVNVRDNTRGVVVFTGVRYTESESVTCYVTVI